MATGENEAVTADPFCIRRIVAHDALEEGVCQRRQAHCSSGMAVADLLNRVGGEHAGGIDSLGVQVGPVRGVDGLREDVDLVCDRHWQMSPDMVYVDCEGGVSLHCVTQPNGPGCPGRFGSSMAAVYHRS